jgi:hypothetical protein
MSIITSLSSFDFSWRDRREKRILPKRFRCAVQPRTFVASVALAARFCVSQHVL